MGCTKYIQIYLGLFMILVKDSHQTTCNIACGKPASHISTFSSGGPPSKAVDGDRQTSYLSSSTCQHTELETNPWWMVDLLGTYLVSKVIVVNRAEGMGWRLRNFTVEIAPSYPLNGDFSQFKLCSQYTGTALDGETLEFNYDPPQVGRVIKIQIYRPELRYLTLCEVEVYGTEQQTSVRERLYCTPQNDTEGTGHPILLETKTVSKLGCGMLCSANPDCYSFNVKELSTNGPAECKILQECPPLSTSTVASPDWQYFTVC